MRYLREAHENAINLYNQMVRFYATHGHLPEMRELLDVYDTRTWHKALIVLYEWGWIKWLRPGVMVLNRPTERDMTPSQLAAMFYRYGVKPLV